MTLVKTIRTIAQIFVAFSAKLNFIEGHLKEKVLLLFPPNLGKTTILSVLPIAAPLLLTR